MNPNPNPDPDAPGPRPFDPRRSQFETLDDVRNPLPTPAPDTDPADDSDRGTLKLGGPPADEPYTEEGPALATDLLSDHYPALRDYPRRPASDSGKGDPYALPGEAQITPDQRSATNKVDIRPVASEGSAARPAPPGLEYTAVWQAQDSRATPPPAPPAAPRPPSHNTLSLESIPTAPETPRAPRTWTVTTAPGTHPPPDSQQFEMEEYATAELPLVPGYEIVGELGRGGMGVVYKARQVSLNRTVALKMVLGGEFADPRELARFLGEAEAIAAVNHTNVIQVFEYGRYRDMPFFAMEYVEGGSLAGWLKGRGPLGPRAAADLVEQIARGVQAAHDIGIVHRDLKPANVLLAASPDTRATRTRSGGRPGSEFDPKVMDFGLAKRAGKNRDTKSLAVMGTPAYMSPEQAAGKSKFVGPAADIYALGVVLYECLTGRLPFDAPDAISLIMRVVNEEPPAARTSNPNVPRDLDLVCLKCLEKDPRKRYPTAAALADDLVRFLNGEPIEARAATAAEKVVRVVRRNPVLSALAAALAVSVVAGVGVGAFQYREVKTALGSAKEEKDKAVKAEGEARAAEKEAVAANQKYIDAAEAEKKARVDADANAKRATEQEALAKKNEADAKRNEADAVRNLQAAEAARKNEEAAKTAEAIERKKAETAKAAAEKLAGELKVTLAALTTEKAKTDAALASETAAKAATRAALDKLTDEALADFLNATTALSKQQEGFLAEVAAVYERLTKDGTGGEDKLGLTRTWTKLGRILVRLGRAAQARAAFAEAGRLAAAGGTTPDWAVARGDVLLNLGVFLSGLGENPADAEAKLREAVAAFEAATATDRRADVQAKLGQAHDRLGFHLHRAGNTKAALEQLETAIKVRGQLRAELPKVPEYAHRAAQSRALKARVLNEGGRVGDEKLASAEANAALKIQRDAVAAAPDSEPYQAQLVEILNLVGLLDTTKRAAAYQEALDVVGVLAAAHPGDLGYKQSLAQAKANVAATYGVNQAEEAVRLLESAARLDDELLRAAPESLDYLFLTAAHRHALTTWLRRMNKPAEAEQECQKALAAAEKVRDKTPAAGPANLLVAKCLVELGTLDANAKPPRPAAAEKRLDAAWPPLAAAIKAQPRVFDNYNTARAYAKAAAVVLAGQNKHADVEAWADRLAKAGGRTDQVSLNAARLCALSAREELVRTKNANSPVAARYKGLCLQYLEAAVANGLGSMQLEDQFATPDSDMFLYRDDSQFQAVRKKAKENIGK